MGERLAVTNECEERSVVSRRGCSPEELRGESWHGGNWIALPQRAGLKRCGKSCRLRWLNYLRPGIKHGGFSEEEDNVICSLFKTIGSRTDNDVKNYWNTKLKKKMLAGQADVYSITNRNDSLIRQTPSPPPLPRAMPLVKSENYGFGSFSMSSKNYGFGSFSMSNENSSSSTLTSVDAGLGFDSGKLAPDSGSFTTLAHADLSSCGGSAAAYAFSPSQDISAGSSSLSTENSNSYVSWPGNGGGGIDAFLMDLGLESVDLLCPPEGTASWTRWASGGVASNDPRRRRNDNKRESGGEISTELLRPWLIFFLFLISSLQSVAGYHLVPVYLYRRS
ncbi:unnamed protein product [Spirodela intermedia]|uniref:HTH myb-type domain-containing protein n=1 Tax=Spirodela intermedia TaxID=51605 RepID=A0A7I8J7Q9_SPIIN|nr:unnamed protein product [Spirodela intermedia]CAA6666080.1 unnamed protein product [Spirodela intermedia]